MSNLALWLMMVLRRSGGVAAPSGLSISGSAVIGQTLTATATGSGMSYQWQRNGVAIGGATNSTYGLVDADFGYPITFTATNAGGSATSAATGRVAETPAQTLGAELLTNGNMETGDPPSSWTASGSTLDGVADERTGGAGAQSIEVTNSGAANGSARQQVSAGAVAADTWLALRSYGKAGTSGARMRLLDKFSTSLDDNTNSAAAWTPLRLLEFTPTNQPILALINVSGTAGQASRYDDVSQKALTLNAQLTAPSAEMRIEWFYTLPGSPEIGTQVNLLARISTAGNLWRARLMYTGTQWNINLYSMATGLKTNRTSATNIGTTNGISLTMVGDQISLYTTANGGSSWTQRGSTITNSLYQTATGVNALWTDDVTPGLLHFVNPS